MFSPRNASRLIATGRLLLIGCLAVLPALASASDGVLVLGRISDDPGQHYGQLKPLLDYVVPRMADVGIREGRILMASDPQQMQRYIRRGRVDWVTETAAMAVLLNRRAGARPILATERSGVGVYHSVVFVRDDSDIRSLADLAGRSLALQRSESTSAYYAPVIALLNAGLALETLLSPSEAPERGRVGYVFAGSEQNIVAWVRIGLMQAGAFSNLDWERLGLSGEGAASRLRVIHRTPAYPRAVELVRSDMPAVVAERLRQVLLKAAVDPAAAPALEQFFDTTGFREIDATTEALLASLGAGVARVKEELE